MNCPDCGRAINDPNSQICIHCNADLRGGGPRIGGERRPTVLEGAGPKPGDAPPARIGVRFAEPGDPAPGRVDVPAGRPKTVLEGGAPVPGQPVSAGAGGARGRTVLDEGGGATGAGRAPAAPLNRIVGWMVSFDHNPHGQEYVIRAGKTRLGRGRDNEVSLFYENMASDLHATIIYRGGQCAVKDESSTNGTFVNGEDIGIGATHALAPGDVLKIGGSSFVVYLLDVGVASRLWPAITWK
jgi:hypothetical protein